MLKSDFSPKSLTDKLQQPGLLVVPVLSTSQEKFNFCIVLASVSCCHAKLSSSFWLLAAMPLVWFCLLSLVVSRRSEKEQMQRHSDNQYSGTADDVFCETKLVGLCLVFGYIHKLHADLSWCRKRTYPLHLWTKPAFTGSWELARAASGLQLWKIKISMWHPNSW